MMKSSVFFFNLKLIFLIHIFSNSLTYVLICVLKTKIGSSIRMENNLWQVGTKFGNVLIDKRTYIGMYVCYVPTYVSNYNDGYLNCCYCSFGLKLLL